VPCYCCHFSPDIIFAPFFATPLMLPLPPLAAERRRRRRHAYAISLMRRYAAALMPLRHYAPLITPRHFAMLPR
jgi:hypothetical protein